MEGKYSLSKGCASAHEAVQHQERPEHLQVKAPLQQAPLLSHQVGVLFSVTMKEESQLKGTVKMQERRKMVPWQLAVLEVG